MSNRETWYEVKPSAGSYVQSLSTSAEYAMVVDGGNIFNNDPADIWDMAESGDIDWMGDDE